VVERLLWVLGSDSQTMPARVCGLLAQRNIPVNSIQMTKPADSQHWWIRLVVCVESMNEVELVANRLNRLVDVIKVIDVSSEPSHQRRSMFVRVRPAASDLMQVSEVARFFAAEVLEVTPAMTVLYLSASPRQCERFLALLAPYGTVEALPGDVSGVAVPESTGEFAPLATTNRPGASGDFPKCRG
jgi:acetolactate synthase I/III small subunit